MLEKTFSPKDVEARLYAQWEEAGYFRCSRPERAGAQTFSIVIPPPNVTGSLHMGHALNNTIQDILARFERMRGKDVLWQPGMDHAGIATQMVVERQLMERQLPGRLEMGREAFVRRIWEWKEESGGTIIQQLRRLGASCDWTRERFTMDEGLSRAVIKVFVELYRSGLIYKDKRLVNWDPQLLTAISDLEVVQVETKGHLWHFRYPLEGKTFDAEDPSTFITVATTRPAGVSIFSTGASPGRSIMPVSNATFVRAIMPWPHIVLNPSLCKKSTPRSPSGVTGSVKMQPYMSAWPRGSHIVAVRSQSRFSCA